MEIWKPVIGWENSHEVSSFGQVRSIARKGSKQMVLSQQKTQDYPSVTLVAYGVRSRVYVHHLVALAFIGSPPGEIGTKRGQYTVNHKDLDKSNNREGNLEWLTCGDNYIHGFDHGVVEIKKGVQIRQAKLNPELVAQIKLRIKSGEKPVDIAQDYGVVKGTIYAIKNGKTWN